MREGDECIGILRHSQISDQPERRDADILVFAGTMVTAPNRICAITAHDRTAGGNNAPLSNPAFRPGQLCRIEPEFFASAPHHTLVEGLTGAAKRNFRFSALPMHGHHDLPRMPLLMRAVVDAATVLHEPFSECGAFHFFAPAAVGRT